MAVGTAADMMVQPFGAVLIGSVAGVVSVVGFGIITVRVHGTSLFITVGFGSWNSSDVGDANDGEVRKVRMLARAEVVYVHERKRWIMDDIDTFQR